LTTKKQEGAAEDKIAQELPFDPFEWHDPCPETPVEKRGSATVDDPLGHFVDERPRYLPPSVPSDPSALRDSYESMTEDECPTLANSWTLEELMIEARAQHIGMIVTLFRIQVLLWPWRENGEVADAIVGSAAAITDLCASELLIAR
jgi:hypothetical protein